MKVYLPNKTIDKLKTLYETQKPGSISMRKYKKGRDSISNVIKGIKLNDTQREAHKSGKPYSVYISKERLREIKKVIDEKPEEFKEGSFLPLIPLILAGIGTAAGVATAGATIAKTVLDKKNNDAKLEEEQRHNRELENAARGEGICPKEVVESEGLFLNPYKQGGSVKEIIKNFANNLKTDEIGRKTTRNFLKNLSSYVEIERQGNGLYLYNPN